MNDSRASGEASIQERSAFFQLNRVARMARKELREILRDRRTIVTLVLMPLLLYPLLAVGMKQLFVSMFLGGPEHAYRVGFGSELELGRFNEIMAVSRQLHEARSLSEPGAAGSPDPNITALSTLEEGGVDIDGALQRREIVVGVRVLERSTETGPGLEVQLAYLQGDAAALTVVAWLEKRIEEANVQSLSQRLAAIRPEQAAAPLVARRHALSTGSGGGAATALISLVPLILTLMTITGAVYPAIDLTAGERERGTLELLVAAPAPRLSLLAAKYVAVLAVALLTALANLGSMAITIAVSGLGPALFGEQGLRLAAVLEIFALLLLFAAFFSGMLLALCSFARSFKEAQAYLVPLMMVSIGPGLLGLVPDLELSVPLAVTPLANIVLLCRDLLEQRADPTMALLVVASTSLYALAAVALAAHYFAAESVLYSSESGWAELLRRPEEPVPAASPGASLLLVAATFPLFFAAAHLIPQFAGDDLRWQLAASGAATVAIFGALPLAAALWRRINLSTGLGWRWPRGAILGLFSFLAAALLGFSLWTIAHEIEVAQLSVGLIQLDEGRLKQLQEWLTKMRAISPFWSLAALAVAPAVCEELLFRGFLFGSLVRRSRPVAAILASGLLFGLFHLITPGGILLARLAPSTLLGFILGWVRSRSGSVWPGTILHVCHNGLLILAAYYQPVIETWGLGIEDQTHLPSWLLAVGFCVASTGAGLLWFVTRGEKDDRP